MRKLLILLTFSFFFLATQAKAQYGRFQSEPPQTLVKELKNKQGQRYDVIITLPSGYLPEKQYNVLYYLDAWWLQDLVTGCYRIKALSSPMEEVILVGISSVGKEENWHKQRNYDYTPSAYSVEKVGISMNGGGFDLNESTSGGADEFMSFFKEQIIPIVESEYKVEAASRGILGHSFGGLFGYYSFVKHPDLFAHYILLSPAVWWNGSELLKEKEALERSKAVKIFMVMGSNELRILKGPVVALADEIKSKNSENVQLEFKIYEDATHNSVLPRGIYDAFEWMYSKL